MLLWNASRVPSGREYRAVLLYGRDSRWSGAAARRLVAAGKDPARSMLVSNASPMIGCGYLSDYSGA